MPPIPEGIPSSQRASPHLRGHPPILEGIPPSRRVSPHPRGHPPVSEGIPLISEGIPPSRRASPHLRGRPPSSQRASPISEGIPSFWRASPLISEGIPPSQRASPHLGGHPLISEGMVKKMLAAPPTHLAHTNTNALRASHSLQWKPSKVPSNPVPSPSSEQIGSLPCSPQFPPPLLDTGQPCNRKGRV